MITVRFPTGFSVQYNAANFISRYSEYSDLKTKDGGTLVAQVTNNCIIEFVTPCRTYNPIASDSEKVQAAVDILARDVRSLKRKVEKVTPK